MKFVFILLFYLVFILSLSIVVKRKWSIDLNTFFKLNEPTISFIIKSFIGIMTLCVAIAANDISEKKAERDLLETAPYFNISETNKFEEQGYGEAYVLENSKGLASYVSFRREEIYYFSYMNNSVSVNLINYNNENLKSSKPSSNQWFYVPTTQNIESKNVRQILEKSFKEKTGQTIDVLSDSYYRVDFADYRNEQFTFYFSYYDGETKLAFTNLEEYQNRISTYGGNPLMMGIPPSPASRYEKQIESIADDVIDHYK